MNDSSDLFFETATFCAVGDNKRPGFVGTPLGPVNLCSDNLSEGADEVTDAVPTDLAQGGSGSGGWYVRIMFDELLDPNVEDLIPILDPDTMVPTGQSTGSLATTQPVIVKCNGQEIAYDGYYSPSGNAVTWPVGPSLFIAPTDRTQVPTSAECTVEIKDSVVDKNGNPVPTAQRGSGGEYKFAISALELIATDPAPSDPGDEAVIVPEAPAAFLFNAFVDPASLSAAEVVITKHAMADCSDTPAALPSTETVIDGDAASGLLLISLNSAGTGLAWEPESFYSITFTGDNAIADLAGGPGAMPGAADFTLCFNTDMASP